MWQSAADEAERGHQRGAAEVQRRHRVVDEGHRAAHQQEVRHHRVEQQHRAALLVADLAHDDRAPTAEKTAAAIAARWPAVSAVDAGPQHHDDPDQPGRHRHRAAPADGLAEDRDRQQRDQQRRREDDRVDLRQRQAREGVEDQEVEITADPVRISVHQGCRGRRLPSTGSRISMIVTIGKPKSVEKKMIWNGE